VPLALPPSSPCSPSLGDGIEGHPPKSHHPDGRKGQLESPARRLGSPMKGRLQGRSRRERTRPGSCHGRLGVYPCFLNLVRSAPRRVRGFGLVLAQSPCSTWRPPGFRQDSARRSRPPRESPRGRTRRRSCCRRRGLYGGTCLGGRAFLHRPHVLRGRGRLPGPKALSLST
jgi:hypothetical protein